MTVSRTNASTYTWGDRCRAWVLVDEKEMSIKEEYMPAGTCENLHYHARSQQFFYILEGKADFEMDNKLYVLTPSEGVYVAAGKMHRICNAGQGSLKFLVVSQPAISDDRMEAGIVTE